MDELQRLKALSKPNCCDTVKSRTFFMKPAVYALLTAHKWREYDWFKLEWSSFKSVLVYWQNDNSFKDLKRFQHRKIVCDQMWHDFLNMSHITLKCEILSVCKMFCQVSKICQASKISAVNLVTQELPVLHGF